MGHRLEEKVIRIFSPNGLLTVVGLIILSAMLFSGNGIERRTVDRPAVDYQQVAVSPILQTAN
jgi:hypothetical protein